MYIDDLYDKSIKKMKNIAKLKKMDLHIHSPASKDYIRSEKDIDVMKEYEKFINKFIDSDLDVTNKIFDSHEYEIVNDRRKKIKTIDEIETFKGKKKNNMELK